MVALNTATILALRSRSEKRRVHFIITVDQDGQVLDILVQRRRDKDAAKPFCRKLLKGFTYVPRGIITDKLPS
jgi:transposase-like protein